MKQRVVLFGIVMIVLAVLAGCGTTAAPPTAVPPTAVPPTATPAEGAGAVLFLKRTGGLQGLDESWTVSENGQVRPSNGEKFMVTAAQVRTGLNQITEAGFFDFKDEYGTSGTCADCITYRLTLTVNGVTKTVTAVQGAADTPAKVMAAMEIALKLVSGVTDN